jgi:isopenicillin N synthase-like dioxygenase
MIPRIDVQALLAGEGTVVEQVRVAAHDVGFLTLHNTPIPVGDIAEVFAAYRSFFALPAAQKAAVAMARTGSNRGWGAGGSEQVDPDANPDYKQIFDSGFEVAGSDLPTYALNQWPDVPVDFKAVIENYYTRAGVFW